MSLKNFLRKNGIIHREDISEGDIKEVTNKMINFASEEDYEKAKILKDAKIKLEKIKIFQENKRRV